MSGVAARSAFMADVDRKLRAKGEKKPRARGLGDAAFARVIEEVLESMREEDWSLFEPRHFVGLYALLHRRVYGVDAAELTSTTRMNAAAMARRLLDREFAGDRAQMVGWMRWAFNREAGRVKWREANGKPQSRVGWYFCFAGALITDWRMADKGARR